MALSELPAYQKTSKSQAVPQEQREESQTQSTSSSETIDSRNGPRRAQKTLVIDLEKEPDGLKDIRYTYWVTLMRLMPKRALLL